MDIYPLKNRIFVRLYGKLLSGAYGKAPLPQEQEFSRQLGVSRNTLRAALAMLDEEGLLLRSRAARTVPVVEKKRDFGGCFLFVMVEKRRSPHVGNSILAGISAAAENMGGRADFCSAENLKKIPFEELRITLTESGCRGIIVHQRNFRGDEEIIGTLKALDLPVVLAYCESGDGESTGFAAINHCGRESWIEALRYLAESGHSRIVTLTLDKEIIRECFTDEEYTEHRTRLGLVPRLNPVLRCAPSDRDIEEKLAPLFKSSAPPDAILCYSDYWALPVFRVLKKMKLRIPQDVSVMGYCGSVDTDFISPKLSTVSIGYEEVGWMAVRMLFDSGSWFSIPGRELPVYTTPYMLQIRESTCLR